MKNKYRLKFSKLDKMIYLGHIDLLKIFQRAINRCSLPIAYSEGFHPHQKISFSVPLALGIYSVGEYVDIVLTEKLDESEVVKRLNSVCPNGLQIIGAKLMPENTKNSASLIYSADYKVVFPEKYDINVADFVQYVNYEDEINITRVNKKGVEKQIDIKPYINSISGEGNVLNCNIATGSQRNLKIDVLCDIIGERTNQKINVKNLEVTRLDMYELIDDNMVSLV